MLNEFLIVILLVFANGALAMAETAVIAARKARLQSRAELGDRNAQAALALAGAPNRFLSTTQIGITLVGILAGAFGGATIAEQLRARLDQFPWLRPYSEALGVAIVVLGITYLSLVIGELVPKRLALLQPERVATLIARPMQALAWLSFPAVHFLSSSTDVVLRLLRIRTSAEPPVSEEEIRILIKQGAQSGVFERAEHEMVENVFRLGDRRVQAIMTPRPEIVWLDSDAPQEEIRGIISQEGFSRYPVGQGSLDHILGVVRAKDLLIRCLAGESLDLKAILRAPLFVPESTPSLKLLELFKQSGVHLAIVLDEYGVTEGIVTHSDVLEAIAGEFPAVGQSADPMVLRRDDGSWLLDGLVPVDELRDLLGPRFLSEAERGHYQTLAGFVMNHLGVIPSTGQHFEWNGWRFEVVDMDGHRIDKVLATWLARPAPEARIR